jgi:hypothetical protein
MDTAGKLVTMLALGVGGYFGYQELLKPYLAQKRLEEQARLIALKTGAPYKNVLAALGSSACKAYATSQGTPPNPLVNAGCDLAGIVASQVILKGGGLAIKGLKGAAQGVVAGSKGVEHGVVGAGKAIGHAVSKLKFWGLEGLSC